MARGWEPVKTGDRWSPTSAEVENAKLAAARQHRGRIDGTEPSGIQFPYSLEVDIKNNSGSAVMRGEAMEIEDLLYSPTSANSEPWKQPVFVGGALTWPDSNGRFAFATGTISNGKIGRAIIAGIAVIKCDVTRQTDRWVWWSDDSDKFKTSTGGFAYIVGLAANGTDRYVFADLSRQQSLFRFTYDSTNTPAYSLEDLNGNSMSQDFTLTDPHGYFSRFDSDNWPGHVVWIDDKFYPAGAPCENPNA